MRIQAMWRLGGWYWILIVGLAAGVNDQASAQSLPMSEPTTASANAYYRFAEPNDLTMRVKVWGDVSAPGLYELTENTSLSTLLTIAGGPRVTQRQYQDAQLQIRLLRPDRGEPAEVFRFSMTNGIDSLTDDPILQEGDILVVENTVTERFSFRRDVLPIVNSVATITVIALQIISLTSR